MPIPIGFDKPSATLYLRALRIADGLTRARTHGLMSAPDTAAAIRDAVRAGDDDWAWRMLLQGRDHLRLMLGEHPEAIGAWEAIPKSTGQVEWDTLLAAITRQTLSEGAAAMPDWTDPSSLDTPWMPEHPLLTADEVIARTPNFPAKSSDLRSGDVLTKRGLSRLSVGFPPTG